LDISTLSRDPEIGTIAFVCLGRDTYPNHPLLTVKAYESDPLVWHSNIPLQLGSSILIVRISQNYPRSLRSLADIEIQAGNEVHQNAERLEVPYILMQGSGDKMVVPDGNQEIHVRAKSKDKSFIMFRDFFHELFNEPEKKHIWQLALNWLNERVLADGTFQPKPTNYVAMGEQDGSGGITLVAAPTL
jgi:alpha-beta hydrolase superfamily lysophospholipase